MALGNPLVAGQPDRELRKRNLAAIGFLLGLALAFASNAEAQTNDVDALTKRASQGDGAALYRLGMMHQRGEDLPQDLQQAEEYLRAALDSGFSSGAVALFRLLMETGRELDARTVLGDAAKAGTENAAFLLARGDLLGSFGAASQPSAGRDELERLSLIGDARATRLLARALSKGVGGKKDPERAVELLRPLAEAGDAGAQYDLGIAVWRGQGAPRDSNAAKRLLVAAVENGYDHGAINLARLYAELGETSAAAETLDAAEAAGLPGASIWHAILTLRGGLGDQGDATAALSKLSAAAADGDKRAKRALASALASGAYVPQDLSRSTALYAELALDGDNPSLERYARALWRGEGIAADPDRAGELLQEAASTGWSQALVTLGRLQLESGRGEEAFETLSKARDIGAGEASIWLARGHLDLDFSSRSNRDTGRSILLPLADAGDPTAAIELSRFAQRVFLNELDLDLLTDQLNAAADAGDVSALASLFRLLDDRKRQIPGSVEQREALLAAHVDKMPLELVVAERIALEVDRSTGLERFRAIDEILNTVDGNAYQEGLLSAYRADNRSYTYHLQGELSDRGYDPGPRDGWMAGRTIRAFNSFCTDLGLNEICQHGPLRVDAVRAMAKEFS